MRWKRRRLIYRSLRKRHELERVAVNLSAIKTAQLVSFTTLRNELLRLPYFLEYYRNLGVQHFLVVDNDSDDGSTEFLTRQPDVSVWRSNASYKASRFGVDWLTCLQFRFGVGKWCLTVDADELLVLPGGRRLDELTIYLDQENQRSFGAVMLDMYPKGPLGTQLYAPGSDPIQTIPWFDAYNFWAERHRVYDNLVLRGGVRNRAFFADDPSKAPTMNKTPLVKWSRGTAYVTSTHQILPRPLNAVYAAGLPSGALLHTKFLPNIKDKSSEELRRGQHFENGALYQDYYAALIEGPDLWCETSQRYEGPDQLEGLGLMTRGNWAF